MGLFSNLLGSLGGAVKKVVKSVVPTQSVTALKKLASGDLKGTLSNAIGAGMGIATGNPLSKLADATVGKVTGISSADAMRTALPAAATFFGGPAGSMAYGALSSQLGSESGLQGQNAFGALGNKYGISDLSNLADAGSSAYQGNYLDAASKSGLVGSDVGRGMSAYGSLGSGDYLGAAGAMGGKTGQYANLADAAKSGDYNSLVGSMGGDVGKYTGAAGQLQSGDYSGAAGSIGGKVGQAAQIAQGAQDPSAYLSRLQAADPLATTRAALGMVGIENKDVTQGLNILGSQYNQNYEQDLQDALSGKLDTSNLQKAALQKMSGYAGGLQDKAMDQASDRTSKLKQLAVANVMRNKAQQTPELSREDKLRRIAEANVAKRKQGLV